MDKDDTKELSRREFLTWAVAAAAVLALPMTSNIAHASTAVASTVRVIDLNAPIVVPDPPPSVVLNNATLPTDHYVHPSSVSRINSPVHQVSYTTQSANYAQPAQVTYAQSVQSVQSVQTAYVQPTQVQYIQPTQVTYAPPVQQPSYVQPIQPMQVQGDLQRTSVNLENRHASLNAQAAVAGKGKVRAVSRGSWSAIPANPNKMRAMNGVRRITIHHEGSAKPNNDRTAADVIGTLRLIQGQHRKRMGAGDIGYHFIIDRTGVIWQGRDWAYQGAHTSGANSNNIGVMLLGNFEIQQPSAAQLNALHSLVASLVRKYGLNSQKDIFGHSDFCNTQCPGKHLKPQVQALRRMR